MSELRLPYFELSPELLKGFREVKAALLNSALGSSLIELVYLRVSQINGCSFCLNMHSQALVKLGEEPRRLHELAGWRCSSQFTERERSALAPARSLTHRSRCTTASRRMAQQPHRRAMFSLRNPHVL